jgi:exopolysaccharide biosynthesis polyprenyl glycosylphosphotransferase
MPEQALLASLGAVPLILLPLRALAYRVLRSRPFAERVVILGASSLARRLVAEIAARPDAYLELVGFVDDGDEPDAQPTCRRLGSLAELDAIVERTRPDRVVVAMTARRGQLPVGKLLELRLRGVSVEEGCDLHERLAGQLVIECLPPASLVFCPDFQQSRVQLAAARALGVLGAVTGLVLLAPVLLLVALAIRLESPGPVFFVQRRLGLHGKPFALVKLRTMRVTGRPRSEWVRDNGDRITPLGRWLRRFRIDELPQLWNVLRGDMNLVGPRPHPVSNHELFRERIPYYAFRLAVRPGITGWAQVRYGYANDLEQETEKTRYDLYYVKHFSLALDLWILWETVGVVLFGRGAEAVTAPRGEAALETH